MLQQEARKTALSRRITSALLAALIALALLPAAALVAPAQEASAAEVVQPRNISGNITASETWNDGDIVSGITFIYGGTAEDPIVITVNGTVKVQRQIYISSSWYVSDGKYGGGFVRFTGGGTLLRDNPTFEIFSTGPGDSNNLPDVGFNLNLCDITIDGGNVPAGRAAVEISDKATVTLENATTIKNCVTSSTTGNNSGVIRLYKGGSLIMDGGTIKDCKNGYGGAINIRAATSALTVKSGTIQNVTNLDDTQKYAIDSGADTQVNFAPTGNISIDGSIGSNTSNTVALALTPQDGFPIASVTVNGTDVLPVDGSYTLPAISTGLEIAVGAGTGDPTEQVGDPSSGDLNGDGDVTADEALMVARFIISGGELTVAQQAAADIDGDGKLTMADAVFMLRRAAGL